MFTVETKAAVDASVARLRQEHADRMLRALAAYDPQLAGAAGALSTHEYALLGQVFFGLQAAARGGDATLADRLVELWHDRGRGGDPGMSPAVVPAKACHLINDDRYLSPVYIVDSAATRRVPLPDRWSVLCAATPDTAWIQRLGAGLVVITEEVGELDDTNSWAVTAVAGTIYTKAPGVDVRPAEAIVHEASHNLLNAVLRASRTSFAEQPAWYSPWKRMDRPAFGIVHAVFAFSVLVTYWAAVLDREDIGDRMRAYCRMRVADEVEILRSMRVTLDECLAAVTDPMVRDLVTQAADGALRVGVSVP